jgi:hypothetical protein
MAEDRAVFWLAVAGLLGVGIVVGQLPAIMIAATTSILLAYHNDRIFPG